AEPLLDLGCHLVDLACWLTGVDPVRARAMVVTEARACFEVELEQGVRLYAECGEATSYRELLELRSEDGLVRTWEWPGRGARGLLTTLQRNGSALVSSWRAQLRALARLITAGDPGRLAPARDGLKVMAALEAVRLSAVRDRDWVALEGDPLHSGDPVD